MDQLQIKLNRSGPSSEERDQKQPGRNAGARQEITVRGERESQREDEESKSETSERRKDEGGRITCRPRQWQHATLQRTREDTV